MRSGATQRSFGSWMLSGQETARPEDALVAGRLAAILLGACALGIVFALFPLRVHAATRADLLAIALVLVAQGLGYAASTLGSRRLRMFSPLVSLICVPLMALARLEPAALGAFGVLAVLAVALELALLHRLRRLVVPLGAFLVPALVALAVLAPRLGVLAAGLMAVVAPLVLAFLPLAPGGVQQREAAPAPRDTALPALLTMALVPEGRMVLVTDAMGLIDAALSPAVQGADDVFPGGSLTEATLIADRVALLQMLARAARDGRDSGVVTLRLRRGPLGAGYPAPGTFETCLLRAFALPGQPGRAGVLIERESREAAPHPAPVQASNTALLARALHDGIAPFNAGLGFLEMVSDPRLAPRDFTVLHDFTAEAHKAMSEAHRNCVLLGLWMRMTQDEAHAQARGETSARRLFTETLRLLNLEDMEKRGDLIANASLDTGQSYALAINAARFALAVLLRFGLGAAHVDIEMSLEGEDLAFTVKRKDTGENNANADAFQQALEQAVSTGGEFAFEAAGPGARKLRLRAAGATRRASDTLRLAS
jgi:hypothetical protein